MCMEKTKMRLDFKNSRLVHLQLLCETFSKTAY